jgi:anti-sigma B factor antagonist
LNRCVSEGDVQPRKQPVISVDEVGDALVVRLGGDLDLYNVEQVKAGLAAAVDRGPTRLVVDLAEVEFVDSTALGAFVEARRAHGDGFRLASPQAEVRRALEISGLNRHLDARDTVDEALAAE